jgi:hypothetical protein
LGSKEFTNSVSVTVTIAITAHCQTLVQHLKLHVVGLTINVVVNVVEHHCAHVHIWSNLFNTASGGWILALSCWRRFQGLILSGSYTDFTPAWYKDVGFSITLVAFLNLIMPGAQEMLGTAWHWHALSSTNIQHKARQSVLWKHLSQ